ncbi:hypothetical protein [Bacillus sp. FJAT-27445]|uniref:hypothetical protein n=1 Tax=Bacillus sp. FJAT-27445 TaxID=1679166 RepID=UPI0007433178|nr:hypothetical protein [Bacillus sp. FJAT-27445]
MLNRIIYRNSPELKFWNWFKDHSEKYYKISEYDREELYDLFQTNLQKVHKDLAFEFTEIPDAEGKQELIISADGVRQLIPTVLKLINAAPDLEKWKMTAFRQRMEGMEINFNGYKLNEDHVFFAYDFSSDKKYINRNIFTKNFETEMKGALYLLLDSCIGEYEVMTKVGTISFGELYDSKKEILPISKLYKLIEEIR